MTLPLRPSLSRAALQTLTLIVLIGMLIYQQWQIPHLKTGYESAANLKTVNAITQRKKTPYTQAFARYGALRFYLAACWCRISRQAAA